MLDYTIRAQRAKSNKTKQKTKTKNNEENVTIT